MTFLGKPTIADEIELLDAKRADVDAVVSAFKSYQATWMRKDAAGLASWIADWGAFWNRWKEANGEANAEIINSKLSPTPNSMIPSGAYNKVLRALTRTPGREQKGDFSDLYKRLAAAGAHIADTPHAATASDVDRDMYNALDKEAKGVEHLPLLGPLIAQQMREMGLGRGTADSPDDKAATKAKWTIAGIAIAAAAGLLAVLKLEK
jgi:hypothetical protein